MKKIRSLFYALFMVFGTSLFHASSAIACTSNEIEIDNNCIDSKFTVTTTNMAANTTFKFVLTATGTFYVDWGDGTKETIASIEYLPVKVNVNGVKANKNYTINLTKPAGIRELNVKTIQVSLEVDAVVSKNIENINIDAVNIAENLKVQAIGEENRTVTVIVNGSQSVIDTLDPATIKAYIDLTGLGEGDHSVKVQVEGSDTRLTYTPRVKEIKVKISQK